MKAIETVYNNYRFRSRLEARWAVFFDALGIRYEYEKEGYNLNGLWYLPDFWLSDQDCWVEVKGEKPTEEEMEKARRLSLMTGKRVYIFFGEVWIPQIGYEGDRAWVFFLDEPSPGSHQRWCECPKCGRLDITPVGCCRWLSCECLQNTFGHMSDYLGLLCDEDIAEKLGDVQNYRSPRLVKAYTAARQARFEHQ